MSSFQLQTTSTFRPKVSVGLNFADDHLDHHKDTEDYRQAKLKIFTNQDSSDHAIVNASDRAMVEKAGCRAPITTFSGFEAADYTFGEGKIFHRGREVFNFSATQIRGVHNAENVMATLARRACLGVTPDVAAQALGDYKTPPHRCELVRTYQGHDFINDSKATNTRFEKQFARANRTGRADRGPGRTKDWIFAKSEVLLQIM